MLTETWFRKSDKHLKTLLQETASEHGIEFIRRDRDSRGGGVSIAYDSNKCCFKKVCAKCLVGKSFEMVAGVGKIHAVKKKHLVIAAYLPPDYKRKDNQEFLSLIHI